MATQSSSTLDALVDLLRPFVLSEKYLKPMIKQSTKQSTSYPLKGLEHIFVASEKAQYCKYCKYCGYYKSNINHITKDD